MNLAIRPNAARLRRAAFAALASLLSLASSASAELVWEYKELRVTATPFDKEVQARFPYKNTGDQPVTIKSLRSSCGCVVPKVADMVVPPGGTGEITATFELQHRIGLQKRPIAVEFDDPKQPKIGLYLYVTIPEVIKPASPFLRWGEEEKLEPKTLTVAVDEKFPVEKLIAQANRPGLDIKIARAEGGRDFLVTVRPTGQRGPIPALLTMEATLVGGRKKRADVYVYVK